MKREKGMEDMDNKSNLVEVCNLIKAECNHIISSTDEDSAYGAIDGILELVGLLLSASDEIPKIFLPNSLDFMMLSDTIKAEGTNKDGGPGSGRYPKGSGKSQYSDESYKKALLGIQTTDGKKIKSIHGHAMNRMKERNIYPSSVATVLKKGNPSPGNVPGRTVYQYNGTHVVVVDDISQIRTVIYKGKVKNNAD